MAMRNRTRDDRAAFTLVELLVVITIIGILASLITAAAVQALKAARQNAIKVEVDQMALALEEFEQRFGSYPPNGMNNLGTNANGDLISPIVVNDFTRQFKKAFPRHREPPALINRIAGVGPGSGPGSGPALAGGMTAAEAIVFWLGGFSDDPKYPISGPRGPSYDISGKGVDEKRLDPIEDRNWLIPLEITRLGPGEEITIAGEPKTVFVDTVDSHLGSAIPRYVEYNINLNGNNQTRRINFWMYFPRNSVQPYVYFDTSRHKPIQYDLPLDYATAQTVNGTVYSLKREDNSTTDAIDYANPKKFQILHCGIDDEWGEEFLRCSWTTWNTSPADFLAYPEGPFRGEIADTIVNFSERNLEDSQP